MVVGIGLSLEEIAARKRARIAEVGEAYQRVVDQALADGWAGVYDVTNPNTRIERVDVNVSYLEQIADGLGNLPAMVQATADNQFRFLSGEFGQLDGVEGGRYRWLDHSTTTAILAQPTLYMVVAKDTSSGTGMGRRLFDDVTNDKSLFGTPASDTDYQIYAGVNSIWNGGHNTSPHIFSVLFNGASSYVRRDAVVNNTMDVGALNATQLRWGNRTGSDGWQGSLGPLLVYNGVPSDTVRDNMENLLHELTGIPKAA